MTTIFETKSQKELKEQYKTLLNDVWGNSEKMINYCAKKADVIVKTESGFFIEVEKEDIETSFCFGYHDSRYDTESFDNANKMAAYAKKSESYFLEENLKSLKNKIQNLKEKDLFVTNHYYKQNNDLLKTVIALKSWEKPEADYIKLSDEDKKLVIEAHEIELQKFEKRLNTYLKRFGTSKLHTWSYWLDA